MTLNMLPVALGSWISFTKLDLWQLIRAWIIAFFDDDTLYHAVTFTFDLLTSLWVSVQNLTKSNNSRLSYWRLSTFSPCSGLVGHFYWTVLRGGCTQLHQTWLGQGDHRCWLGLFQSSDILLHFQTLAAQSLMLLKTTPNFALFDPPVKNRGGRDILIN